jgi:hypothetical protein
MSDDDNLSVSSAETLEEPYNNSDMQFYEEIKGFVEELNTNVDDLNEEVLSYIRQTVYDNQDPTDDILEMIVYYDFSIDRYKESVINGLYM